MPKARKITEGVFWVGAVDWDRRLFDALIPLPDGTSYNAYLVKGSEKTALLDTVDPSKAEVLMRRLEGVEKIDYIIAHHAEQDHSGAIPRVLEKYPEAEVLTSAKGRPLVTEHLRVPEEKVRAVEDGETLSLGDKTLEFISAQWVHWPETMFTYLREDKVLFTCDLFGSHLATSGLYLEEDWKTCDAAKRYYAEVMMPFRAIIKKHLEKIDDYEVAFIAPSHGPVHRDPKCIIEHHKEWVSDKVSNTVVLPYVTMHGSTEIMVDRLTEALDRKGVNVQRYNLSYTDNGKLAMSLVDAATLVVGSPTVLSGAHPVVVSAAFLTNALKPKLKFASIIGSYGWGGRMVDQIKELTKGLKVELIEPVLVKGKPTDETLASLDALADEIARRHRESGVVDG